MQKIKVSELFGPAGYWEYEMNDGVATPSFIPRVHKKEAQ